MASIAKLKDKARKFEQKEDWQAAIAAYQEVLEKEEGEDEVDLELTLYNRIGDLHLRLGQTDDAVSYYETAADKYAESGFLNNAIALCNKALRHRPDRAEIYLKLSGLCAEQGFQVDARRWILEYVDRRMKAGQVEDALSGLEDFADMSDDPEIREMLAEQLASHDRPDEAVEQLRQAYRLRTAAGQDDAAAAVAEKAQAIDPSVDLAAEAPTPAAPAASGPGTDQEYGELTGLDEPPEFEAPPVEEEPVAAADLEGLETRPAEIESAEEEDAEAITGLEVSFSEQEPSAAPDEADADALGGLETFTELEPEEEAAAEQAAEEEVVGAGAEEDEEDSEPLPMLDTGLDEEVDEEEVDEEEAEPLPMLDTGFEDAEEEAVEEEAAEPAAAGAESGDGMALDLGSFDLGFGEAPPAASVEEVENLDVEAVLDRSRKLVSRDLTGEALRELRLLSGTSAGPDVFRDALGVINEIVRHDANDVAALQTRVEYSARTGDRDLVVDSFMDLADSLARLGAETKAQAMYERVLDLDPENEAAREALGAEAEEEEEAAIDLDAVLREMEPDELETAPATGGGDSDPQFAAMLSQFKAKVTEQVDVDEAGDHYDLGLAFKEMGLIDEAIAEFQTALTGGTERLKVYEELGQCYIQKGQYNVAIKVLDRALQIPHTDQEELLGVHYHLGQCYEELGQRAEAREAYEKVLALDDSFADVPDRMARL